MNPNHSPRVAIVGATGYVGGELLRLLIPHQSIDLVAASSRSSAGRLVSKRHPHLRGATKLRFCDPTELPEVDLIISAMPHGQCSAMLGTLARLTPRIIDCSADFRIHDSLRFQEWYGPGSHALESSDEWTYGLPELHRESLRSATRVSGVGCNATAINLALLPLFHAGILTRNTTVIADVKAGTSEGGRSSRQSSHHPERAGVLRSFAPTGHRHTAEVEQEMQLDRCHVSLTSIDRVRGALATCQVLLADVPSEQELWQIYRECCSTEPFLRIVHERSGSFRQPDLKLLDGTNFADLGWARDERGGRLVALSAIDNLGKGAAGTAVQCANLMLGLDEQTGLEFRGIFPN